MSKRSTKKFTESHNLTEIGNAKRFVELFGGYARYSPQRRKWLFWDGRNWGWDTTGIVERAAKQVIESIYVEAANASSKRERKSISRWAEKSESAASIASMIKLARTEKGIPIEASSLDRDVMLLGVNNGVIDLRSGRLRSPDPKDYITKFVEIDFEPGAEAPIWNSFLQRILDGDHELIEFVKRVVGYCLTGLTREQCMFIFYGGGANGKSVLVRVVQALMAVYAATTPPETLMARRDDGGPSPALARLPGVRLVAASEPNEYCILNVALIKSITGQDVIVCRNLYEGLFEFVPQFKLILVTNFKPIIRGEDHAIWRRIVPIPFNVTIPKEERDKELIDKLLAELPGILNWAIDGTLAYQRDGLNLPEVISAAVQEYRTEMDLFGDWIRDCCELDPKAETPAKILYQSYREWCEANGLKPMSNKSFGARLKRRGYESFHTRSGTVYRGLISKKGEVLKMFSEGAA